MEINIKEIEKLSELANSLHLSIKITEGDKTISIKYCAPNTSPAQNYIAQAPQNHIPMLQPAPTAPTANAPTPSALAAESQGHAVKSPMVGTLYRAPAPGAANFVEIGARVKVGQTLCIIEAMKMMNQIEADKAGVIKAIMVDSGTPVEFDQPLFIIADE